MPKFIKKIKRLGYAVKLDTNGSNPKMLKDLIDKKLIDYVAMDIKGHLELKSQIPNSKSQTNAKFQISKYKNKIKKSVELLKNSGLDFEFRTTVVLLFIQKKIF